jgi:hypothetical protein
VTLGPFFGPEPSRYLRPGAAKLITLGILGLGGERPLVRARGRERRLVVITQPLAEAAGLGTITSAALGTIGTLGGSLLGTGRRRGARVPFSFLRAARAPVIAFAPALARSRFKVVLLVPMIVLGLHVRDVQETIAADGEIDERGLDCRLEIDNLAFVDVTGVALVAGALDVQFLKDAILDDGDTAFLGLEHVDQHFFLHTSVFLTQAVLVSFG